MAESADAIDHGRAVLATILRAGRSDLLESAVIRLDEDHFVDSQQKTMWRLLLAYLDAAGGVVPREALSGLLRGQPGGTVLLYQQYYDALLKEPVQADGTFSWHVSELRELAAERATGQAIAEGMEILRRGATIDGEPMIGHASARSHVLSRFSAIDRSYSLAAAPEGDVKEEGSQILDEYLRRRTSTESGHGLIATGLDEMDRLLGGGLVNGELDLVAAFTSHGKTSFIVQLAWFAYVVLRKNVVIFTSETLRPQIRVKLVARHSRASSDPETTARHPFGLDSAAIKAGRLDPDEEQYFARTVRNFTHPQRPNHLHVAQIAKGSTVGVVEAHLGRITRDWPADLVIIDYLQLLKPDRRRQSKREELADIVPAAKEMAATYLGGRGVPVVSPWQISREGYKNAQARGFYETTDLAETHESSATADVIFSLLDMKDGTGKRAANVKGQLLKNRDGDTGQPVALRVDYATSLFTPASKAEEERETATPFG